MENFGVPEPQWIMDQSDSGPLFWRRDSTGNKSRVKFRCDVEILEFSRESHEMEDPPDWPNPDMQTSSTMTLGMTFLFCIAVTVMLPWYIIGTN